MLTSTHRTTPYKWALGIILFTLIGTVLLQSGNLLLHRNSTAQLSDVVLVDDATAQLQVRMEVYAQALYGSRAFMAASQQVNRDEWHDFTKTSGVLQRLPGLSVLSYIERVPASQRVLFEQSVRTDTTLDPEGYPNFKIFPDQPKSEYLVVKYLDPFDTNLRQALGFDFTSESIRANAYEVARDTNQPTMTAPIKSVDTGQTAFLLVLPVYEKGMPNRTLQERQANIKGLVTAGFRPSELFGQVFGQLITEQHAVVEVFDGPEPNQDKRLFDSTKTQPVLGDSTEGKTNVFLRNIKVADRVWTIRYNLPKRTLDLVFLPTLASRVAFMLLTNVAVALAVWLKMHQSQS